MKAILSALIAATAVVWASAALADDGVSEHSSVDISPAPGVTIHTLAIDNRLGDVIIEGRDAPSISLTVVKHAPDEETLDRLKVNLVPDPSGVVSISSAVLVGQESRPIAASQIRIDIHVSAPRGAAVQVRSWDGKLGVSGMRSGAILSAHAGDIAVSKVRGLISTTNMRGQQRFSDVDGTIDAAGTYGDMDLDGVVGDLLAARVHRGSISAQRVRSMNVRITTTFGDIHFRGELLPSSHIELRAYAGDVDVRAAGNFNVDAYARDGRIEPQVELMEIERPESGRIMGTYGVREKPAALVLSSAQGRVVFGLMNE